MNQNTLDGSFARIVRENSEYYLLGYSPINDAQDGTYRRLEVRVKRPGLQVRSRSGYFEPRGRRPVRRSIEAMARSSSSSSFSGERLAGGTWL